MARGRRSGPADAGLDGRGSLDARRLRVRTEVRRRAYARTRGAGAPRADRAPLVACRQRQDGAISRHRQGAATVCPAAARARAARRRSRRARCARRGRELSASAEPDSSQARRARRRRPLGVHRVRPAARRPARPAWAALDCPTRRPGARFRRPRIAAVAPDATSGPGRARPVSRGDGARLGGSDRQARLVALPLRQAFPRLGQAQTAARTGVRRRRLDRAARQPRALRRPAPGRLRRARTPDLRRPRRHRVHRGRAGPADEGADAAGAQDLAV